jgi:HupE/UreJ protein
MKAPAGQRCAGLLALLVGLLCLCPPARAHYVGSALLQLAERPEPGRFVVRFIPSTAMQRSDIAPEPSYPAPCQKQEQELVCGPAGLVGEIRVAGLTPSSELIVQIDWHNGRSVTRVLNGGRDRTEIEAVAGQGGALELVLAYGRLGLEHIAEGVDHLLFVLGLVLLVGFRRGLLWAITGFTLAHSLTLGLSVTGLVVLRPLPVEALIAFSLMLVAAEAWHAQRSGRTSLSRRFPALFAFGFGLVHGLGFGGALREIGVPDGDLGLALLAFNLGVELGQVAFVGALFALVKLAERAGEIAGRRGAERAGVLASRVARERLAVLLRGGATYVVGSAGAYLFLLRVAALVLVFVGLGLCFGVRVSQACPDEDSVPEQPIGFVRQGSVWELSLPHPVLHHDDILGRAEVAAALTPALRDALRQHLPTVSLMDEIGRRQGVVLVGVGEQAPFLVVPSGRSPFKRLVALEAARGGAALTSLSALLRLPPASPTTERTYYAALNQVLPEYPRPVLGAATYGKLVGTECNIGAREKFLLLALADGRVALLSRAGFLQYVPSSEQRVGADTRKLGDAERWSIERHDAYTISLKSPGGTYLRWGARDFFELDAAATAIESAPVFQRNRERFFLWVNGDGTVSLKLADNRVSVSVAEWQIPRQGQDVNCHYYGYRQDPSDDALPVSVSLGSPP